MVRSGGAQLRGVVGAGRHDPAGETPGAPRLHIEGRVAHQQGLGGTRLEFGQGVGGESGLRLEPRRVARPVDPGEVGRESEMLADRARSRAQLVGEDGASESAGVKGLEEGQGAGQELDVVEQRGVEVGAVDADRLLKAGGIDKAQHGALESAADRRAHGFVGRSLQAQTWQGVHVAAVDRTEVVDQCAIEVEENETRNHERHQQRRKECPWASTLALPPAGYGLILGAMSAPAPDLRDFVGCETEGGTLRVALRGRWRLLEVRPAFADVLAAGAPQRLVFSAEAVESWDASLPLFLVEGLRWARDRGVAVDLSALPAAMRGMAQQVVEIGLHPVPPPERPGLTTRVGEATLDAISKSWDVVTFIGDCVLALARVARRPRQFRWADCAAEMQNCGAMALPIVSLISLLVGLIMAYQAAVQLRQFGADIYVADLVGLAVVREMGPMMAAVIMAGRTGAAFAATLGNMKAGEEIDALETLGLRPVDFLVLPRLLALGMMMPLLALYANLLGILGGMAVAWRVLEIPPAAYWVETQSIVDLSDVASGLIKSVVFGLLIGLSGCLRGLQADRSAAGVGKAATSAVVTAILLIIVADAIFAVVFNLLGI